MNKVTNLIDDYCWAYGEVSNDEKPDSACVGLGAAKLHTNVLTF